MYLLLFALSWHYILRNFHQQKKFAGLLAFLPTGLSLFERSTSTMYDFLIIIFEKVHFCMFYFQQLTILKYCFSSWD